MKKILFILVIGLAGVITSCNWFGGGGDPITPQPVIVQAGANPVSVEYLGSTVFSWKVLYADSVRIDGVKVSNEGSMPLDNLTNNKTIIIVAYSGILTTAKTVVIPVGPAPIIPDRTDSICSMVWSLSAYDNLDKDGNVVISWNLDEFQKTNKLYFYKDGTSKLFDKNGKIWGPYQWKWTGINTFLTGDQTYRYKLDGTKFYWYQSSNDGSEIYRNTYTGVKI